MCFGVCFARCSVCSGTRGSLCGQRMCFCVIHISTVNSAGKSRHKCKQNSKRETEISMYPRSLCNLSVIHGLQCHSSITLHVLKLLFSVSLLFSVLHSSTGISHMSIFTHLKESPLQLLHLRHQNEFSL